MVESLFFLFKWSLYHVTRNRLEKSVRFPSPIRHSVGLLFFMIMRWQPRDRCICEITDQQTAIGCCALLFNQVGLLDIVTKRARVADSKLLKMLSSASCIPYELESSQVREKYKNKTRKIRMTAVPSSFSFHEFFLLPIFFCCCC